MGVVRFLERGSGSALFIALCRAIRKVIRRRGSPIVCFKYVFLIFLIYEVSFVGKWGWWRRFAALSSKSDGFGLFLSESGDGGLPVCVPLPQNRTNLACFCREVGMVACRFASPPQNRTNLACFCRKVGMEGRCLVSPFSGIGRIWLVFVGKWGWRLAGLCPLPQNRTDLVCFP